MVRHADAALLARAVAARLLLALGDAQADRGTASVVLTGGGIGIAVLREVAASPLSGLVDWNVVDVWWGDERWLPDGDGERNETQARTALLDALPLDPARVHPMGAAGGEHGDDAVAAATAYSAELTDAATGGEAPAFDVLLLGVGPEGHIASLFPHAPALAATGTVTAVRDSPKPPAVRISLTPTAIAAAREVWIIAAGQEKAAAVAAGARGAAPEEFPVAGARGRVATRLLVDAGAATDLDA